MFVVTTSVVIFLHVRSNDFSRYPGCQGQTHPHRPTAVQTQWVTSVPIATKIEVLPSQHYNIYVASHQIHPF